MDRFAYAILPLQPGEDRAWREIARTDRSFDAAAERACRLGYLSASLHLRLDPEASLGLKAVEGDALLALARVPAETTGQARIKVAIFRSWAERGAPDAHLASMFRVARACDAMRLASAHGDVRFAGEAGR